MLSTSPSGEAVVENYPAVGPLFGRSAGTDIFVAASVSELAYYDANGGRFTEQMRDIIRRLSKSSKVTWGDVARELRPISTVDEQDKKVHVQSPYAVILP